MTTAFTATADSIGWYVTQARDTTADLIAVLLQSGGQTDGALADHATLAAILAGGNTECDFTNYARKVLAGPARSVDAAGDRVLLTVTSPITWVGAGGANNDAVARILYCYKPDAASVDSAVLPLMATDISATTNGNDLQVTVHADGFATVTV